MLEFLDFVYIGIFVLVMMIFKEIIEYVFITRRKINIETFSGCSGTTSIDNGTYLTTEACERSEWLMCYQNFSKLVNIIKKYREIKKIIDGFDNSSSKFFKNDNIASVLPPGGNLSILTDAELKRLKFLSKCMRLGAGSFDDGIYKKGHEDNRIYLDANLYLGKIGSQYSRDFVLDKFGVDKDTGVQLHQRISDDYFYLDYYCRRHLCTYAMYLRDIKNIIPEALETGDDDTITFKEKILDPYNKNTDPNTGGNPDNPNRYGLSDIYIDARNVYLRTASTKIGTSSCSASPEDPYWAHDKLQVNLGKPNAEQGAYFYINRLHQFNVNRSTPTNKCGR
jgi:hypothetical protein